MDDFCNESRGGLWSSLRGGAAPLFHTQALTSYAGTINKAVDQLLTKLTTFAETGEEVNISKLLGGVTMDVIGQVALG